MPAPVVAVAYSGGRDSSALLHATVHAAAGQGVEVVALHVHHGLSARADDWLEHCARQCRRWAARGLPLRFDHRRLAGAPARGESVEAWARRSRYAALTQMANAHAAPIVLLAHHRLDQAETFLLQALRGAGVAGLAAMPAEIERNGVSWVRPWLEVDPERIAAYAHRHRLRHVDDDSNANPRFDRNRLRHQVWPALSAAFPQVGPSLAAAAVWAAEARACADDLAAIDLAAVADARGLQISAWLSLTPARRSNALRAWLRSQWEGGAPAALVLRLLDELPGRGPARWADGAIELRRYRGRLTGHRREVVDPAPVAERPDVFVLTRAGTYRWPGWRGRLRVRVVNEGGVPMSALAALRLVERQGGERFQAAPNRPPRSLKKQFQAAAVPAWQREGPLLFTGSQLLYVPGLGTDARALAAAGTRQISLEWLPDVT